MKYECFFCGDEVSSDNKSSDLDPCAIVLIAHWEKGRDHQQEQQFWCHFECFRKSNKHAPLYIEDLSADEESN